MTIHTAGLTKRDQALAAAIAHPGVDPAKMLDYVPSIGNQARAAALLDSLHEEGLLERRGGGDLWQFYPAAGARVSVIEDEEEEPVREPPRGKRGKKGDRQIDHAAALAIQYPGNDAKRLAALMVPPVEVKTMSRLLYEAVVDRLLSQARVEGTLRYWKRGEAPADEPKGPKAETAVPRPPEPPPASPAPATAFLIEDKPIVGRYTSLVERVYTTLMALKIGQSFLVTEGTKRGRDSAYRRAKLRPIGGRKFSARTEKEGFRIGRIE